MDPAADDAGGPADLDLDAQPRLGRAHGGARPAGRGPEGRLRRFADGERRPCGEKARQRGTQIERDLSAAARHDRGGGQKIEEVHAGGEPCSPRGAGGQIEQPPRVIVAAEGVATARDTSDRAPRAAADSSPRVARAPARSRAVSRASRMRS